MASKSKDKGDTKEANRIEEGLKSKDDDGDSSPTSMNGDLDDGPQLWIHAPEEEDIMNDEVERKKLHNVWERRRKDKIKRWVSHIATLLPPVIQFQTKRDSTLEIMEKTSVYIQEMQDKNEKLLMDKGGAQVDEIKKLRKELEDIKSQRDKYADMLKHAGISLLEDPSQWKYARSQNKPDSTATTLDCESSSPALNGTAVVADSSSSKDEETSHKTKSRRKNLVSSHLENKNSQQHPNQASALPGFMMPSNFIANSGMPMMNPMFGGIGQQVLANQNLLMNPAAFQNASVMPGMQNPGSQSGVIMHSGQNTFADKAGAVTSLGLLQLAMQDAGITPTAPSDGSRQTSPDESGSSDVTQTTHASSTETSTPMSASHDEHTTSALQTLASVASNTQNAAVGTAGPPASTAPTVTLSQNNIGVTSTTSSVNSIMSLGPPGYTQMMQTGNMMLNMPMIPGQQNAFSMMPNGTMGNVIVNQHGQIIMLNDQGVPVIAGIPNYQAAEEQPVKAGTEKTKGSKKQKQTLSGNPAQNSTDQDGSAGRPPSVSGLTPVQGQQMVQGLQQMHQGQQGQMTGVGQGQMQGNVSASMGQHGGMAQTQLSTQQNQLPGFPQQMSLVSGSGFQTIPMQGQPQGSMSSGQQINQSMLHMMPNMIGQQAQSTSAGSAMSAGPVSATSQGVIPVSQAGNGNLLALNTVPSQPNQLPTALILPNGQIIPVVTNPQPLGAQQNAISSNVHMVPGQNPQMQLQQMPGQAGPGVLIDPNNPLSAQVVVGPSVQIAPNQQQLQQQQHNLQQQQIQQQMAIQQQLIQQQVQQMNMSLMMTTTGAQGTPASATITVASNNMGGTTSSSLSAPGGSIQSSIAQNVSSGVVSKVVNQTVVSKSGNSSQKVGKLHSGDTLLNESDVAKTQAGKSQGMSQSAESVGLNTQLGQTGINTIIGQPGAGVNPTLLQPGASVNPGIGQTSMNSAIGQSATMFNPVTGQTMNPAMGQMGSNMNPPLSGANINQPMGQSGAILLNLPVNGQQMNVLVDPVTMQVLGTLPPPQPQAVPAVSTPVSSASSTTPVNAPVPKRSSKKGHRAICPKPKHGSVAEKESTSDNHPHTEAASNWETPNPSNTDASHGVEKPQEGSGENSDTDILAKAAESIFLASEISPTSGNFYNPANEDNPLHIDTSVGDVDDDATMGSPSKTMRGAQTSDSAKSTVKSAADVVKGSAQMITQPLPQASAASELQKCAVPATTKAHVEIAPTVVPVAVPSTPKKSKSRSKSSAKDNTTSDSKTGGKKSSKKKKETVPVSEPDSINTLPESITFSESQLSDVLDQVENFVPSAIESPPKKSRKGKSLDDEPSSKKRKKSSGKEKDVLKKSQQDKPEGSSKLSVYDFQDSPPEIPSATKRTGVGGGILHSLDPVRSEPVKTGSDVNKSVPKKASTTDENFDMIENVLSHLKREQERASKMEQQAKSKPSSKKKKKSTKDKGKEKPVVQPTVPPVCTSSSSPDNTTVVSQTIPITQKVDLMENDVTSSMLSPPSNNSTQSQSADAVTAAISSSGMDSLMELTAPSPILTAVPSIAVSSPAPITTSVLTPSPGLAQSSPVLVPSPELMIPSPPHSSSPGQLLIQSPEFQSPTPGIGLTQSPQSIQNSPSQSMLPSSVPASSPASGSSTPRYQSNFESHVQQPQSSIKMNHMSHAVSTKPQDQLFPHTPTSVSTEQQLPSSIDQSNSIKSPSHQNLIPSTQMNSLSQLSTSPSHSNQTKQPMTHIPVHGNTTNALESNTQIPGLGDQMAISHASPHHPHQHVQQQHPHPQPPQRSMPFQPNLNTSSAVPQSAPIPSPGRISQESAPPRVDDSSLSRLDASQNRPMTDNSGSVPRMDRLDTAPNKTMGDNSGHIPRMDTGQNRTRVDSRTNSSACSNYQPPQGIPGFSNASNMLSPKEQSFGSPPHLSSTMKLTHLPATGHQMGKSSASIAASDAVQRSRSGIFSAENFVEPSRNGNNPHPHTGSMSRNSTYGRMNNNDPSSDSFNFTSIGLNLTSNSAANSLPNTNNSSSTGSTPFSFSLTPVTSTATTTTASCPTATPSSGSSQVGHHQFPFYPLHPSVSQPAGGSGTSNTSSDSQAGQPHSSVNMLGLGMDLRMENSSQNMRQSSRNQMSSQPSFGFGVGDVASHESPMHDSQRLGIPDKVPANSFNSSTGGSQKRHSDMAPNRTIQSSQHMDSNSVQRPPQGNNPASYFSPSFHSSSASLNTPPLHHPPIQTQSSESSQVSVNSRIADNSRVNTKTRIPDNPNIHQDTSHLQQDSSHLSESTRLGHMRPNFPSNFPSTHQSSMLFGTNRFDSDVPFNRECSNPQQFPPQSGNTSAKSVVPPPSKQKSPSHSAHGLSHPPSAPQNVNTNSSRSHNSNPTMTSSQSSSHPGPQQQSTPQPHGRSTKSKKQSKKSSKQTFNMEMDTNLSHSIFDSNQGIPSYFQIPSLPPSPSRNLPNEGPFLPGNFFGSGGRPLSNASASMPKNSDLGTPFNSLFSPSRPQNGLGLNFQPAFGMNPGNPGNSSQMPPSGGLAVTPHMSNFSLGNLNFLSDVNVSQCDSLNISPIKFHANPMLPHQPGTDPNGPLQHPHQGPGLYHNRGHPGQSPLMHNSMSINSLLGHNPHGFDTRGMGQPINSSVGPPFHGHGHPGTFAMPPLNFSIHEH